MLHEDHPVEAVIFDLDGTLLDSAGQIAAAINIVLGSVGLEIFSSAEIATHIGWGSRRLIETAFAARGRRLTADEIGTFDRLYLSHYAELAPRSTVFFPGALETLQMLHDMGVTLAICTNKPQAISRAIFAPLPISAAIPVVIGGDSGYGLKPDGGPVSAAHDQLRTAAARTLFVGDSVIDAEAADAAGIPFAHVQHPGHERLETGHPIHWRLEGLRPLVERVANTRRSAA